MKGKNQSFSFMMELIIVIFFFCIVNNCMYFIFSQSKRKTNGWSYDSKCYVRNAKYD